MKEAQFVAGRQAHWSAWDRWLAGRRERRSRRGGGQTSAADGEIPIAELSHRFRTLSQDLALAGDGQYSSVLLDSLHRRVLAVHQRIYGERRCEGGGLLRFVLRGLPELVRQQWRVVMAAALLFFGPLLAMLAILQIHPDGVYFLLSPEYVGQVEEMYDPNAPRLGRPRGAASEWMMWGFYIANNVRIDFQCFAGGIAFGLGSVIFLAYNGLVIGAVTGHLTQLGYIETFWGFVAGHSSFELIGAVLSGAAGLRIGMALVAPGRRPRLVALKEDGSVAVRLLYGAAGMTFAAAFIEAFWSPLRSLPIELKYGVGIVLWLVLIAYLLLAGRPRAA